jgi:hypothetical protein
MKIVVSNSEHDFERERHTGQIQAAYDRMAANFLRVLRGSGDIGGILHYAADYVAACQRANEAGHYPVAIQYRTPTAWEKFHSIGTEADQDRWRKDGTWQRAQAIETIISGALQIVASELLDQKSQRSQGEREFTSGLQAYEQWKEDNTKRLGRKVSKVGIQDTWSDD